MLEDKTNTPTGEQVCPAVGCQTASICVPVTVTPFAHTGAPFTECCGDPVVAPGENACCGIRNGSCSFTISQNIRVAVPVQFGAQTTVGDAYVACSGVSVCDDCAHGCGDGH